MKVDSTTLKANLKSLENGLGLHHYDEVVKHLLNRVDELEQKFNKGWNDGYNQGCEDTHKAYKDQQ